MQILPYLFAPAAFALSIRTVPDTQSPLVTPATNIPLIIWHGLGDAFDGDGIKATAELYQKIYPGTTVFIVSQADDGNGDRQATFLGNVSAQIEHACDSIKADKKLASASAANYLGYSQGGQFARGLIQRCNVPPARNLVTFGSQHNGIFEFAECQGGDWWCRAWSGALRSNTWADWVQNRVIPAQYYRDPEDLESYLEHSAFLADINNERKKKEERYKHRIGGMSKFVMYMFEEDTVVKPKESAWFAEVNKTTGKVTALKDRPLYKQDWLGLKLLGGRGGLFFKTTPGEHMRIGEGVLEEAFEVDFAPEKTPDEHAEDL